MPIKDFDPKKIADNLAKEAADYLPKDLTEKQKNYVAKEVQFYMLKVGNRLVERYSELIDNEQAKTIVQFTGEWTFHKNIDIIRADIPFEYWTEILRLVAYAAFESAVQAFIEEQDQNKIAEIIESQVDLAYESSLKDLSGKEAVTPAKINKALFLSNVNRMVKNSTDKKYCVNKKLLSLFVFLNNWLCCRD